MAARRVDVLLPARRQPRGAHAGRQRGLGGRGGLVLGLARGGGGRRGGGGGRRRVVVAAAAADAVEERVEAGDCLLYTSPSPRDS